MLKFYFNGSPNPTKVALFLEEAGIAFRAGAGRHPQGRPVQAGIPRKSIRTARCRRSTTTACSCSTATPSCSISPRRPANSCPPNTPANRAEMLSWLMFVATGLGPYSAARPCISSTSRRKTVDYAHNRYQFEAQRHYKHPRRSSRQAPLHGRRHLHHRRHGVWGWARMMPFVLGEDASRNTRTSSGWSTRSRPARRRPRRSR